MSYHISKRSLATAGFQAVKAQNTKSENPRFAQYFWFIYELYAKLQVTL